MKKTIIALLGILGITAFVMTSCKDDEECIDCIANDIVKKTVVLGSGDSTITIYPVITPINHEYCDSMVFHPKKGGYVAPYEVHTWQKQCTVEEARDSILAGNDTVCPCRKNLDTVWNDTKNSFFYIENIKKFPYNRLYIKTNDDTTKMRIYTDYNNIDNQFIGEVSMDTTKGYYEYNNTKALATGIYSYFLILYQDKVHQVQIGDTIKGKFAIIRNTRISNRNCKDQAADSDDQLLH